jgi:hypothetical protein
VTKNYDTLAAIEFRLDPQIDEYEREVLSFFEVAGEIGGIHEIVSVI